MHATIGEITAHQEARFAQLINKSNQFNLRTMRYSEAEIAALRTDENVKCIGVTLADKFAEYGLISCIILRQNERKIFIDTWLMSCRVLKRQVEDFVFEYIVELAKNSQKSSQIDKIEAEYIPTKKNQMVKDFYTEFGFEKITETDEYTRYELRITPDLHAKKHYIKKEVER